MGTSHLIAVQLDGQYRIAQYGQWDGYPSGQGETVLDFLGNTFHRPTFEAKLRAASWITAEESEAINELGEDWKLIWPQLSRDLGAEILQMVQDHDPGIKLKNSISFAADSLFCEWGYVIDLDKNVLEVYKGFNQEPLDPSERFYGATTEDPFTNTEKYYPIRRVASYSLHSLPTQQQLEEDCDPDEVEAGGTN
jgi:hypothetical protein